MYWVPQFVFLCFGCLICIGPGFDTGMQACTAFESHWKPPGSENILMMLLFCRWPLKVLKIKKMGILKFWRDRAYSAKKNGSNWFFRILQSPRDDPLVCGQQHASRIGCIDAFCNRIFVSNYTMQIMQIENDANAFCKRIDFSCSTHQRPRKNK